MPPLVTVRLLPVPISWARTYETAALPIPFMRINLEASFAADQFFSFYLHPSLFSYIHLQPINTFTTVSCPPARILGTAMTFATLRALHAVIGTAINDIERVYSERSPNNPVDYPSLDEPYYTTAHHTPAEEFAESLKSDPTVVTASMNIVAACAQLSATVNKPWSRLMSDMLWVRFSLTVRYINHSYHGPHGLQGEVSAAVGLLEAANIVEILRETGPGGLHVQEIYRLVLDLRTNSKTAAPPEMVALTPARLSMPVFIFIHLTSY